MYRIANINFEGALRFEADRIYAKLPQNLTEAQLSDLKGATVIEILDGENVKASYDLIGWASIENDGEWLTMSWFRYNTQKLANVETAVENHSEELGDILDAITELGNLITQVVEKGE